ncbi:hypothetical protein [Mycolicibacterium sediminis]|uniref:Uncharacterized protein n=1 Tax=Mycolicibacterium sediminis TaxID=1286180 RepID=A0A7I7QQ31_9MYCO|nr:hypothetical protein [Mycolicibacterium sediminis]BBY28077.1 hypothetical protein MSEDJ_21730 [Mycolicibacterium sediminis]
MDDATFDRELRERLALIDNPDGSTIAVPDLPLRDFLIAVISLAVAIVALTWWAY